MQVLGSQFALKKITDYVMSPPPSAPTDNGDEQPQAAAMPTLDGQVITDEDGNRLGIARRLANVQLYVIADTRQGLDDEVKSCIGDEGSQVFFHHYDDGTLAGLIYVPSADRRPAPVAAQRAEDI